MKFNAKALLLAAGFMVVLWLAVSARQGTIDARFAIAGIAAIIVVELLVTPLGHLLRGRGRVPK